MQLSLDNLKNSAQHCGLCGHLVGMLKCRKAPGQGSRIQVKTCYGISDLTKFHCDEASMALWIQNQELNFWWLPFLFAIHGKYTALHKWAGPCQIYESGPNISDSETDQTTSTIPNSPQKKKWSPASSINGLNSIVTLRLSPGEPGSLPKLLPVRHCELGPALTVRLGNERESVGIRQSHLMNFDEFWIPTRCRHPQFGLRNFYVEWKVFPVSQFPHLQ